MNANNGQNNVKKIKFFRPFDVVVYIIVAVAVILSFTFIYGCNKDTPTDGFSVERHGKEVLTYVYGEGLSVNRGFELNAYIDGNKIYLDFNGEKNVLLVDDDAKTVSVTDANCSTKDCITAGELSGSGVIVCLPHNLKILPTQSDNRLIVGGLYEIFN